MKKQIPNIITLCNLLCGVVSLICILFYDRIVIGALLIVLAAVFDFFDGMVARLLKVSSPIGKELDSLSDVVSFGVVPSVICFKLLKQLSANSTLLQNNEWLCFLPLLMVMFSSYRLAKFNIDTRQSSSFIGLPTPANSFVWLSLPLIDYCYKNDLALWGLNIKSLNYCMHRILLSEYFILIFSVILGLLLVSNLPMFSLKFHDFSFRTNKLRYSFLLVCLLSILLLNVYAFVLIILIYIIFSLINNIKTIQQ